MNLLEIRPCDTLIASRAIQQSETNNHVDVLGVNTRTASQ